MELEPQRDHRNWLATLPPPQRSDLTRRSDAAGLRHLAGHLGMILLCGGLIAVQMPGWWLLLPVQGVMLVFLFTLAHEATHRTPFASDWLNAAAGHMAGLVIVLPFIWFRYLHFAHHRWTNIPGRDPELEQAKPRSTAEWALHVSGLPYWFAALRLMARLVAGRAADDFLPAAARARVVAEARMMAVVYALAALSLIWSPVMLWVWLVPILLGQPVLRLYLLAEHGDCPHVADMFLNTRTTFTTRVVRFLAWNMPYHTEHHVAPTVPFHRLPELHLLMRDRLGVTADGYAAFNRAYLARRLRGEMVAKNASD
jgi:fatty acid desaturase